MARGTGLRSTPRQVLAGIEGWADAAVQELSGGLTNRNWLVEAGDRRAVLKIDPQPRTAPYNSRQTEARIQSQAHAAGIANAVIYWSDTALMTEFVDGVVWTAKDLFDRGNLDSLAAALRRLHSLPGTGRRFDAVAAGRQYARQIDGTDARKARALIARIESVPQARRLCRCHNDLVAQNVIVAPGLRFLDWEYACDNDPLFDLATVVAHHQLPENLADYLLGAYVDGDGRHLKAQLRQQMELYDALLWLWQHSRR